MIESISSLCIALAWWMAVEKERRDLSRFGPLESVTPYSCAWIQAYAITRVLKP
jgi:hypothetical protein